ncbi:MAG: hypothetical protein HKN10_02760 [Myxococcales bacterium]|nr:hypothetical protein [Myxococcales bacterium]
MPLKIGVMGGAGKDILREHLDKAANLGQAIAEADCIVIIGACPGLPLAASSRTSSWLVARTPVLVSSTMTIRATQ